MKIAWFGTAALKIHDEETTILIDPFIRRNRKLKNPTIEDYMHADAILVTHSHFDHISDIPKIADKDDRVTIYCTKKTCQTLKKFHIPDNQLHAIAPDDTFSVGKFRIKVYHGKHVSFDAEHIKKVFLKCAVELPLVFHYVSLNSRVSKENEIVIYEIENGGKRILVMGSYGADADVTYPKNVDLFVMPFGGSPKIGQQSLHFIDDCLPKSIMADHHDDAFPPLTSRMDAEGFEPLLKTRHPEIGYIVPTEYKEYTV